MRNFTSHVLLLYLQIVFEGVVGDSYTGDIAVDNISLGLDNSCTFKPVTARREIAGLCSVEISIVLDIFRVILPRVISHSRLRFVPKY